MARRSRCRASASPARRAFAGGFGRATLGAWGEPATKRFVQEAIDEAIEARGRAGAAAHPERIAMLHYSPIRGTVEGEPLEIFPFLGTSRLEEPLNRHPVNMVFHGHAHHGSLEGRTSTRYPGLQRGDAAAAAHFPRPPAVPGRRDPASLRRALSRPVPAQENG